MLLLSGVLTVLLAGVGRGVHGQKTELAATEEMRFQMPLLIPPVMYDDSLPCWRQPGCSQGIFEVAERPITQQVLPPPFPPTEMYGYGNPYLEDGNPSGALFMNPANTIEVTNLRQTFVRWVNELVKDPVACRAAREAGEDTGDSCEFVPLFMTEADGVTPDFDPRLHWANPGRECLNGENKTDCHGFDDTIYEGPLPMVVHLHGGHTRPQYDGFPESWVLPDASNIPEGYSRHGTYFASVDSKTNDGNKGYAIFQYENKQEAGSATLWFHDHSLGITEQLAIAVGAGFYLIREEDDTETLMEPLTCDGEPAVLPGPPPQYGIDPNDADNQKNIREIPIAIVPQCFWDDASMRKPEFPQQVAPNFPVINGRVWPTLDVAAERYRFRVLNASPGSHVSYKISFSDQDGNQIPFYVIGADQGPVPNVVRMTKDATFTKMNEVGTCGAYEEFEYNDDFNLTYFRGGLPITAAERYDIIVDFAGLPEGTEVTMDNANAITNDMPTSPAFTWFDWTTSDLTDQLIKFTVRYDLNKPEGDLSTHPDDLVFGQYMELMEAGEVERQWTTQVYNFVPPNYVTEDGMSPFELGVDTGGGTFYLGSDGHLGQPSPTLSFIDPSVTAVDRLDKAEAWGDPVTYLPRRGQVETWAWWGWAAYEHPMHIHQSAQQIIGRYRPDGTLLDNSVYPWERGLKDVVIMRTGLSPDVLDSGNRIDLPNIFGGSGMVTKVNVRFDIPGLYVTHCHFLAHEDGMMMRPFCVADDPDRPVGDWPDGCPAAVLADGALRCDNDIQLFLINPTTNERLIEVTNKMTIDLCEYPSFNIEATTEPCTLVKPRLAIKAGSTRTSNIFTMTDLVDPWIFPIDVTVLFPPGDYVFVAKADDVPTRKFKVKVTGCDN